ncbi:HTH domain-containing protein, partial [Schaedlerella arabinosiphila]|uniref:HTH domain-containing protein n=1 Tax=Schaedlerella arabinosiphila TaxID=2044587 RepID=UPI0025580B4D
VTKDVTKDVAIEIKILALIKENASITSTEMARQLSVNRRTIQRGLDVLKSKGTYPVKISPAAEGFPLNAQ